MAASDKAVALSLILVIGLVIAEVAYVNMHNSPSPKPQKRGPLFIIPPIEEIPPPLTGTSNCVFFGYWQGGAWHSVSQVVAEMNSSESTGYNQQRNCFIDQQGYYWVYAYEWTLKFNIGAYPNSYEGFSSPDGVTWSAAQRLMSFTDGATSFDHHWQLHQGLDVVFHNYVPAGSYNKAIGFIGTNDYPRWLRISFNNGILTREDII